MILAIDVDEVLADLNPRFIEFLNKTYSLSLVASDWQSSHTEEVLHCSREEAMEKIKAFYASPEFKSIKPITGAVEAINHLQKEHRLLAITARHDGLTEDTMLFLKEHFGDSFSEVFFTNHTRLEGPATTKAEICVQNNVDFLIDDNLEYALECADRNIRVLLLDAMWNKEDNLPAQIERVTSWEEIVEIINNLR